MHPIQANELPRAARPVERPEGGLEALARELDEMLLLGAQMPPGELYLFFYYGQLAITTAEGLANWPEGPREVVAIIGPRERRIGLPPERKKRLLYVAWHIRRTTHTKAA